MSSSQERAGARIPQRQCSDAAGLVFGADAPWLAPLAGYSDLPFRLLCRAFGASVCETEMISAKGLLYGSQGTGSLLRSAPGDEPLVIQLFGGEPASLAAAVKLLRKSGYDAFDFNMGCPVRKVMRQKAGAALLAEPERALEIAAALLAACNESGEGLPQAPAKIGFKFRLDPQRKPGFVADFGRKLQDAGATWLCLHPRTAQDGFGGRAHWSSIRMLREAVEIPVIASGDLSTAAAGAMCMAETGANTVMYARASLANPLVFAQHVAALAGRAQPQLDRRALKDIILRHVGLARAYCGDKRAFAKMRSIIPRYVRGIAGVNELRQKLCQCADWADLEMALNDFLEWENR